MDKKRQLKSDPIQRYLIAQAIPVKTEVISPPASELKLCIVIPAMAEREDIGPVLDSLEKGNQRLAEAEVIVIINNPEDASTDVISENKATLQYLRSRTSRGLKVIAVDCASAGRALEKEKAGVGLARRLGMDLALQRLYESGNAQQATIAGLDADSPVAPGYIDTLLEIFATTQQPLGGVCAYAHPIPEHPGLAEAIVNYELWLRYFELGLRLSGSLFAYTTIGSCLIVSAYGYALADGMPIKTVGEDFYFWQKLVKVNGLSALPKLHKAVVFPKVRVSERLPFGTSRAMYKYLDENYQGYKQVEPPEAFFTLRKFIHIIPDIYRFQDNNLEELSLEMRCFLQEEGAWTLFAKLRTTYPSPDHFSLAAQQWFDGLRSIRYIHYYTGMNQRAWILDALREVLRDLGQEHVVADLPNTSADQPDWKVMRAWLKRLREIR